MFKKQNGITLVALVITIIVLLILAGITIATLTGESGLLNRAKAAGNTTKNATAKENYALDNYAMYMNHYMTTTPQQ